jgi:Cu/Ag efflux protein CusF
LYEFVLLVYPYLTYNGISLFILFLNFCSDVAIKFVDFLFYLEATVVCARFTIYNTRMDLSNSRTLRMLVIMSLLVVSCAAFGVQTGNGEGVVIDYIQGEDRILIEHGEIPGLMDPMTMEFTVDDKKVLAGVKNGDKISITVEFREPSSWVITRLSILASGTKK